MALIGKRLFTRYIVVYLNEGNLFEELRGKTDVFLLLLQRVDFLLQLCDFLVFVGEGLIELFLGIPLVFFQELDQTLQFHQFRGTLLSLLLLLGQPALLLQFLDLLVFVDDLGVLLHQLGVQQLDLLLLDSLGNSEVPHLLIALLIPLVYLLFNFFLVGVRDEGLFFFHPQFVLELLKSSVDLGLARLEGYGKLGVVNGGQQVIESPNQIGRIFQAFVLIGDGFEELVFLLEKSSQVFLDESPIPSNDVFLKSFPQICQGVDDISVRNVGLSHLGLEPIFGRCLARLGVGVVRIQSELLRHLGVFADTPFDDDIESVAIEHGLEGLLENVVAQEDVSGFAHEHVLEQRTLFPGDLVLGQSLKELGLRKL